MNSFRNKTWVVDKKNQYVDFFRMQFALYDSVKHIQNTGQITDDEYRKANLFFVVIYNDQDLINLVPLYNRSFSLIIASPDPQMLKKLEHLEYAYPLNLSASKDMLDLESKAILNNISSFA